MHRLALGLLDRALVNAFIVHRAYYAGIGKRGLTYALFTTTLQAQLLAVKPTDMVDTTEV